MSHVHIIHENDEWTAPLVAALSAHGIPWRSWHLAEGRLDPSEPPPAGVFYNRMSASSHTRGHRYAPEYTAAVLAWLEAHGARVVNPSRALALEINKVAQYAALKRRGVRTPRTIAALGADNVRKAAGAFDGPFITKHNRAGKGLGVKLFESREAFERHLDAGELTASVDGVMLLQQYIKAPTPHITRVEFVGRELLYAVRVDTSQGFELCPADVCQVEDAFCPTGAAGAPARFEIVDDFAHPLVAKYRRFLDAEGVDVAAFEFIVDAQGRDYTYDVNTNTNYNPEAEARAGISGMKRLARYLGDELARTQGGRRAAA